MTLPKLVVLTEEQLSELLEAAMARVLNHSQSGPVLPEMLTVEDFATAMQCSLNTARAVFRKLEAHPAAYITRLGREYRMSREAFARLKRDFEGRVIPTEALSLADRKRLKGKSEIEYRLR